MKRTLLLAAVLLATTTAANCSRARVESLNKMNEGVLLAQTGRAVMAVEALERATAIDPTNQQAFYNLALVHLDMGKPERAREDLEQAIAAGGDLPLYQEKLGVVLVELENWGDAKEAFERAIELDPEFARAHYRLARVHEQLDEPQKALESYTTAIRKGPRFLEAYTSLGRMYADLGYPAEAKKVLDGALEVAMKGSDTEAEVHLLLGTVYQDEENYADAIREFKQALEIDPSRHDALFSLGWAYAETGEPEEARRYLSKFVEVATPETPSHYVRAARDRILDLETGP